MLDSLTGLRRDNLRAELAVCEQTCCWVDIDGLIWVNDQRGFQEGDRVLVAVARGLEAALAEFQCSVFRVAGEEFLALFHSATRPDIVQAGARIVSGIRDLEIPYARTDRPDRTVLEVNVALLAVTSRFPDIAINERGLLTIAAGEWIAEAVYREKQRLNSDAGIVVDLVDRTDCPWAPSPSIS